MSILEIRNASFAYRADAPLFKGVTFQVKSDERLCLQAPSGFGKTTLCLAIAGYLPLSDGEILLDGTPVPREGVCPIQLIWQHPESALDPRLPIKESLLEAGSFDWDLMRSLGIREEWLSRYPRELSGGEMQRCCIARALRTEPRFLIADEVSTMLDAITQVQIWDVIKRYCASHDAGLIMVSHSLALARRIATRVFDLTQEEQALARSS